ncbi:LOW QUALITY PROTEIN: proline dehydrogenase 1, mitochondrial [Trematomus bernacchii]|uniref:LOW QUALITY PROTEIN: proline dehydrogenase 1, mitochondrial n=1 Tax=Trematomus bernacchii TaxID=40690 RepID=UPI00146DEB6A|nr:LOW QUALITY PROTEIN: proline dehydrogenase 1, mitochondrial [Trematomus bernacchii]
MGAPQGRVLRPLLFTLLTHDCTPTYSSNHVVKFADDTTNVGLTSNNEKTRHCRKEVNQLATWYNDDNLFLNVSRTTFLGVNITEHLSWRNNTTSITKKAQQHLYFIHKLRRAVRTIERKLFEDRRGSVTGARSYFYADEAKCDKHMETFIKYIKASGGSSMDGFTAIKMTALGQPQFLLQFSEVLAKWRQFFAFLASKHGGEGMQALEQRLKLKQLQLGELEPLLQKFNTEEEKQMDRMLQRMDILVKKTTQNGVRLMVDAEQTYLQPAISRLTLEMQRIYNKEKPVIFNTYQCYLQEAYDNITMDVELSRREVWHFAAKLVRGAYMYQERERARDLDYEDPNNPDYESNIMYHRCLDYVLVVIALNRNANVMVASHNEDTVKHTLRIRMNELGLSPTENKVYFGQLLGMCDQISFPLVVPYGPVSEVMPYLSRRAQENRGFMKGAQKEQDLLWKELKRRLASGELLCRPAYKHRRTDNECVNVSSTFLFIFSS